MIDIRSQPGPQTDYLTSSARAHGKQADALSGAFNYLNKKRVSTPSFTAGFVSYGMRV